jgi:hypothetical protein
MGTAIEIRDMLLSIWGPMQNKPTAAAVAIIEWLAEADPSLFLETSNTQWVNIAPNWINGCAPFK